MKDRQIYLGGRWSSDDLGVEILAGGFGDPPPRILKETVAGMNGSYNFSNIDGELHYDDRKGSYTFCIRGRDAKDASNIKASVISWLYSGTELYDENIDGYIYTDVCCTGVDEPRIIGDGRRIIQLTANFTAAPFMRSRTGQLIDCLTFTPNSAETKYLFGQYHAISATATTQYYLSRLTTNGTGSLPNTAVTFTNVQVSQAQTKKVAVATITGGAPEWYLMPKTMGSTAVEVWSVTNGAVIKETDDHYCIFQNTGSSVVIYIDGFNYSTSTEAAVEGAILHSAWYYPDDMQSFEAAAIPSTNDMRIISEGDPAITINGAAADVSHFALAAGDLLTVTGAKSEPCKLQYCTVKERR